MAIKNVSTKKVKNDSYVTKLVDTLDSNLKKDAEESSRTKLNVQRTDQNYRKMADEYSKMSAKEKNNVRTRNTMPSNDKLLDTSYKMNKAQKKVAKEDVKDYFKNDDMAKKIRQASSSNPNLARKMYESLSPSEQKKYDEMNALWNKTSNVASFTAGALEALPGFNKAAESYDKAFNPTYGVKESLENAKKQNTGANIAGNLVSNVGQYALAGELLGGVKGFDKAGKAITNVIPGLENASGKAVANILRGQAADTLLDTLPRLVDDISQDKSGKEVALNALKNQGVNLGYNLFGEALGSGLDALKSLKGESAKKAARAVDELNIEDLAKDTSLDLPNMNNVGDIATDAVKDVANASQNASDVAKNGIPSLPQPNIKEVDEIPSAIKQRGYAESIQNKTDLPPEIKAEFDNDTYKVLSNAETSAKADANYVQGDVLQSISNFNSLLKDKDASAIPLGSKIAKDLIATGDDGARSQAVDILRQMSEELTRSGQFTQSAAITLMQNDPMTAMRYMQKEIDSLNKSGAAKYGKKWNDLALSSAEQDAFLTIDPGDSDAINNLYDSIKGRLSKEVPSSLWEKIVSVEKTSMLLNPLTHIKNVAANVALMPIRSATDRVSALGQNMAKIINPDIKVTQSLTGGSRAQKKIASDYFDSIKDSILGDNKMSDRVASDVLQNKQIFKDTPFGKWVNNITDGGIEKLNAKFGKEVEGNIYETLANFNMWMMGDVEDNPFVKQNFVNRLASYMKAQGIKSADEIPDDAVSLAIEEAMKATFKDDNAFTNALSSIKKNTGKFGEVLLPFTKTPANLAMRALDYSPVGVASSIKNFKNTKDVAKFMDDLSKNLTGTAAILIGYKLAENGIINGAFSDDYKMSNYQRANGEQEYAINADKLGEAFGIDLPKGRSFTYDWAQPAAIPFIIGTTIYDAIQKSDRENFDAIDALNATKDVAVASADRWMELSPLQSLKEAFTGDGYGNDSFGENILSTVANFPGRFIPSVVGAAARTKDDTIRDTYNKADSFDSWKNSIQAKLPGLSENLPISYDIWGRERTRSNSTGERVAEQFLSPSKIGNDNAVRIDDELNRLAQTSGEPITSLVPGSAKRYVDINGVQKNLTNEEHSQYQQKKGSLSLDFANAIIASGMSDDKKVEAIQKAYTFADRLAKEELFGFSTTSDKKLKEAYDKNGTQGLVDYFASKGRAEELGVKETDAFKDALQNGTEEQYAKEYRAITETAYGKNSKGETKYLSYDDKTKEIYSEKGEQGIHEYASIKQNLPEKYNNSDLMGYINSSSMNDSDKAYFYMMFKKGELAKVPSLMDNVEDQYSWYYIKSLIDTDGNGSLKKDEKAKLIPTLQANNYNDAYINRVVSEGWFK